LKSCEISEAFTFKEEKQFSYTHTLLFSEKSFGNYKNMCRSGRFVKNFQNLNIPPTAFDFPSAFLTQRSLKHRKNSVINVLCQILSMRLTGPFFKEHGGKCSFS
jgi:hypothetical protein